MINNLILPESRKMLEWLLNRLDFEGSNGWLEAKNFDGINGPSGALRRARESMGVYGAFGSWQYPAKSGRKRFVPLAYVATAENEDAARDQVHRKVWSQGLVPILFICIPGKIILSEGFGFSQQNWDKKVKKYSQEDIRKNNYSLDKFHAKNLLSSLAWRDFSINPNDRVDKRLLSTLEALSDHIAVTSNATRRATNSLIGRFLYFYMLLDRQLLTDQWLAMHNAQFIFDTRSKNLEIEIVWKVFDELDSMLNGSIFPLTTSERSTFNNHSVNLLRDCIKFGDEICMEGIQLSFIDFDLSSLQTETLSAIYEQFLESEDSKEKRKAGAFYTPPFLADFLLDKVEDEEKLHSGVKVLDCTAGSGVFVVGAYRRIIEQALSERQGKELPAHVLRDILTESIFAIEKNPSAHAVTTFSLYLTMLDYVRLEDINTCLEGKSKQPLFPSLKENIVCGDVFDPSLHKWNTKFHVLIGNPPWQKLSQVTSFTDEISSIFGKKVDMDEAAEYSLWVGLKYFVEENGVVALVLPTKSFVGASANRFPCALAQETEIVGVANFANLRYELFSNARQAAAALILRNNKPSRKSNFWVYTPTKANLPGPINTSPWLLNFDRAYIERNSQRNLLEDRTNWFELLMLRPIDRYIRRFISDSIAVDKTLSFKQLLKNEELELSRGGSPIQTGLPEKFIYGADKFKKNDFRFAPGVTLIKDGNEKGMFELSDRRVNVDKIGFEGVEANFERRFAGEVLVIPRSMKGIAYAKLPFAFNSSLNALYFSRPTSNAEEKQKRESFLQFLGSYLESDLAAYLFAINGSLWILDHTRIEKNDLLNIPVPINKLDDEFIDRYASANEQDRTGLLCEKLGLDSWIYEVINEYNHFRSDFEDGGIPKNFQLLPNDVDIKNYKSTLKLALRPISENLNTPVINIKIDDEKSKAIRVEISLIQGKNQNSKLPSDIRDHSLKKGIADFSDSTELSAYENDSFITIRKPAEKFRWTMETAFTDAAIMMQRLLDDSHD